MHKYFAFLRRVFVWSLLFFLFVLTLAALFLLGFEHELPYSVLENLADRFSNSNVVVCAESVVFRFPHYVRIGQFRVFDRSKAAPEPILSAEVVDVRFRLATDWAQMVREVNVHRLRYPRLPNGYYVPDSIEFPGSPDFRERDEPVELDLPVLHPFRLKLTEPDVLSVRPRVLTFDRVESGRRLMRFSGGRLEWPDADAHMEISLDATLDLEAQRVHGVARGQARQPNIRPMLSALDITNSYQWIDAFTGVDQPVDAACAFDVNLRNSDLRLALDLHPKGGFHHGVPLQRADGKVVVRVFVRDTFQNALITVGPIDARMADGTGMNGSVVYENTNDVGYVTFDVQSRTSLSNALAVADVLNDGTLDCLQPETPPTITLKGLVAVDPVHAAVTNNLRGTLAFDRGRFFSIPLRNAYVDFAVKGTDVVFTNAVAKSPSGGVISGSGALALPKFQRHLSSFAVDVDARGLTMDEFSRVLGLNAGDRHALVDLTLALTGPLGEELPARVEGKGRLVCREGHLGRFNFFAGVTDFLAKTVPGVAWTLDQSTASMDFTVKNGFVRTENLSVDGNLFSIEASGAYSIVQDVIDMRAKVTLKRRTVLSTLMTPLRWVLPNFLEFKASGKASSPIWTYAGPELKKPQVFDFVP